jgi:hypothetical protein
VLREKKVLVRRDRRCGCVKAGKVQLSPDFKADILAEHFLNSEVGGWNLLGNVFSFFDFWLFQNEVEKMSM